MLIVGKNIKVKHINSNSFILGVGGRLKM